MNGSGKRFKRGDLGGFVMVDRSSLDRCQCSSILLTPLFSWSWCPLHPCPRRSPLSSLWWHRLSPPGCSWTARLRLGGAGRRSWTCRTTSPSWSGSLPLPGVFCRRPKKRQAGSRRLLKWARGEFSLAPVGGDLDVQRHLDVEQVLVLSQVLRHLALQAPQFDVQLADGVLQEAGFWTKAWR